MSAPSTISILRGVPCKLIWNPTDLGQAEPYGGSYLGSTADQIFEPNPKYYETWDQTRGSGDESYYLGEEPVFKAVVRYYDADMLTAAMPKAVNSGSVGVHWLFRPGGTTTNTRAGTSPTSGKLLIAPRAANAHPMLILYNAIPQLDSAARIQWSLSKELDIAVVFKGLPDASGRVYDTGRRGGLIL